MCLYFLKDAFGALKFKRYVDAGYHLLIGIAVAVLCSIVASLRTIDQSQFLGDFLSALVPMIGLLLYSALGIFWTASFNRKNCRRPWQSENISWIEYYWSNFSWALVRTFFGITLIIIISLFVHYYPTSNFNIPIITLTLYIIFLAFFWIWDGAKDVQYLRRPNESWGATQCRMGRTVVGATMLRCIVFSFYFFLVDAGIGILP